MKQRRERRYAGNEREDEEWLVGAILRPLFSSLANGGNPPRQSPPSRSVPSAAAAVALGLTTTTIALSFDQYFANVSFTCCAVICWYASGSATRSSRLRPRNVS